MRIGVARVNRRRTGTQVEIGGIGECRIHVEVAGTRLSPRDDRVADLCRCTGREVDLWGDVIPENVVANVGRANKARNPSGAPGIAVEHIILDQRGEVRIVQPQRTATVGASILIIIDDVVADDGTMGKVEHDRAAV